MNLEQWVNNKLNEPGTKTTRRKILEDLASVAGVAYMTLAPVAKGARMGLYAKARAVSEATGWQVSIPELCDPELTGEVLAQFQTLKVMHHA